MKSFLITVGVILYFSIHLIDEGHVGVYKNLGVVQKKLAKPGFRFVVPFMQ
jgi:regulator of protease activity HflC (stomatin/prohibitin superfamily)